MEEAEDEDEDEDVRTGLLVVDSYWSGTSLLVDDEVVDDSY